MTDDVPAALDVWLGRDGADDRRADLLARLDSDPAFRRAFAAELHLLGMLQVIRAGEPRWLRLETELAGPDADPIPADRLEDAIMRRVLAEPRRPARRWVAPSIAVGLIAAAVGVLALRGDPAAVVRPAESPAEPGYWGAVAQSRPWAAWRFDRLANGRVPSIIADRPTLVASGGVTAGPDGAAVFRPDDADQALVADAEWTPPRADGYAVELWFRAAGYQKSTLAGLIAGEPGKEVHSFLAELADKTQEVYRMAYKVRGLDRWPPGEDYGANLFSARKYQPDHWHHLVVQRAGDQVRLALDGETVEAVAASLSDTGPVRLILGRLRTRGPKENHDYRLFVGRLADVALYDHPLTPDDIQAHLAAGRRD